MVFERLKTPGLAHVAYLLASGGEAALVDPRRDIDGYLQRLRAEQLQLRFILLTHRQEDFVVGAAELADVTGAKIVTGVHPLSGRADVRLREGHAIKLGELTIRLLETPGHTPESVSFAIHLGDENGPAWGVFTGDALFIGETGRTDLTDPSRTAENAGVLHDSIHRKLAPLGDGTLIFPAHGSGSVCGGKIADRDDSTLGLERATNPAFTLSREDFIDAKVRERLPRPPYFSLSEQLNLRGGVPWARPFASIPLLPPEAFEHARRDGLVIDTRLPEAFAAGHLPGSYSVWLGGLPIFGGWIASSASPVFLLLDRAEDAELALRALVRIGIDGVRGILAGGFEAWRDAGLSISRTGTITPRALLEGEGWTVLDVREISEFEEGHIPGARHVYVGELEQRLPELDLDRHARVAVTCSVGHRASLGVSMLARHGFTRVANLLGGMSAWKALRLPVRSREAQEEDAHAPS